MPRRTPPAECPGDPVIVPLALGVILSRIHSLKFGATDFNPTPAPTPENGGRFDSIDGSYSYLYAGENDRAALAEAILKDVPFPDEGPRQLPSRVLEGRARSRLTVRRALRLVSLRGADLGQVGQDTWLTKCSSEDYLLTRQWAAAIRRWVPVCQGFVWRSRRDEDLLSYVLFGDRIEADAIEGLGDPEPLESDDVLGLVRGVLLRHNVILRR